MPLGSIAASVAGHAHASAMIAFPVILIT